MIVVTANRDRVPDWSADPPAPGTHWLWEPGKPGITEPVVVLEIKWNGEEWWVTTFGPSGVAWNELDRFKEAVT